MSKRLVPEAVSFVASALLALSPRRKGSERDPSFPDSIALGADVTPVQGVSTIERVQLAEAINSHRASPEELEQQKVNLLAAALRLAETFAMLYISSQAFIEMIQPLERVLQGFRVTKLSPEMKVSTIAPLFSRAARLTMSKKLHLSISESISRRLAHAKASRQPLTMQAHKPIPIASFAPRFERDFAPGRHYDPDVERNASSKLKSLYKKERKGAIRELRKDNKFLAGEKAREQEEKDKSYNVKMRKVEGEINMERAEEKAMERSVGI